MSASRSDELTSELWFTLTRACAASRIPSGYSQTRSVLSHLPRGSTADPQLTLIAYGFFFLPTELHPTAGSQLPPFALTIVAPPAEGQRPEVAADQLSARPSCSIQSAMIFRST